MACKLLVETHGAAKGVKNKDGKVIRHPHPAPPQRTPAYQLTIPTPEWQTPLDVANVDCKAFLPAPTAPAACAKWQASSAAAKACFFFADESSYQGCEEGDGKTIEYQLHLVLLESDVLGWFNGLWEASRGGAVVDKQIQEGMAYIAATLGPVERSGGRWESRLHDMCTVSDGESGVPPAALTSMLELGELFRAHAFPEREAHTGPEGLTWGNTSEFDWAFAFLDVAAHGEAALRARLANEAASTAPFMAEFVFDEAGCVTLRRDHVRATAYLP